MSNNILEKIPITAQGLAELKEELRKLVEEKRPVLVERLSEARKTGDLTDNSEYESAKVDLDFVDGRIAELQEVIDRAVVIEENNGKYCEVKLGCKVTVKSPDGETTYHIVGEWEADPLQKKISHKSPLGSQLLGKKVGDEFEFEAPAGRNVFKITAVE